MKDVYTWRKDSSLTEGGWELQARQSKKLADNKLFIKASASLSLKNV